MRIKRLDQAVPLASPYTVEEREGLLKLCDALEFVAISLRARRGAEDRRFAVQNLRIIARAAGKAADALESTS